MVPGLIQEGKKKIILRYNTQTNETDTDRLHLRANFQYSHRKIKTYFRILCQDSTVQIYAIYSRWEQRQTWLSSLSFSNHDWVQPQKNRKEREQTFWYIRRYASYDKCSMLFFFCLDFPVGLVSAKHKTLDIQIVLDWNDAWKWQGLDWLN